eukprot:jgi/Tetstr1/434501/TSEL_023593.t1
MDNITDNPDPYCEKGKPGIPLTFAIAVAQQSRNSEPYSSSWEAVKKMKWLPITNVMPLSLFNSCFSNVRRTARHC